LDRQQAAVLVRHERIGQLARAGCPQLAVAIHPLAGDVIAHEQPPPAPTDRASYDALAARVAAHVLPVGRYLVRPLTDCYLAPHDNGGTPCY
jgi:hypothetical protein